MVTLAWWPATSVSCLPLNHRSKRVGVLVALALVALCTLVIYPLKQAAPVVSLGVVYMLAVVVVSVTWGVCAGCWHLAR